MSGADVVKFYENKNVLITGASGFLGKVLLWKLIESCPNIGKIYVLLRAKNNSTADKRLIQMLKSKPFSPKYDYTDLLAKVVAIEGEITTPGLGLSQSDRQLLCDQVNVVFHSAASVRFDAPLKDNMRDNLFGTREMLQLCNEIKTLDSLVHVSTAYSNCHLKDIREDLIPLETEVDDAIQLIERLPADACKGAALDKLLEGRPNTYTYTKALAEHLVAKNEAKFPIAIVRPSIVISARSEPSEGWVDNVNGIAGLGSLAAIGLLRTIDWNYFGTSDMVPVDYVANCLICAGYQVRTESPKKIIFYNMTSGNMSPISWGEFFWKLRHEAKTTPSTKIVRPIIEPPKWKRANPIGFVITKIFSELLFAYLVDTIIALLGYKKIMVKITKKMHHGYKILLPFTANQWNLYSDNVMNLSDSLSPQERETFKFDMRNFDWDRQAHVTWNGARLHLLKEEPTEESHRIGRARQSLVTFVHYAGLAISTATFAFIGYTGVSLLRAF